MQIPFIPGPFTEATVDLEGLAAFTEEAVKETTETTAKTEARAIFLSMVFSFGELN